jgi:hypothetical protein
MITLTRFLQAAAALFFLLVAGLPAHAADKTILFIAGPRSHGPGQHEHNAGVQLLARSLAGVPGVSTRFILNGWPADATVFKGADAVILFCDGGPKHLAIQENHLAELGAVLDRGVGLGLIHYAVEPTLEKG